MSYKNTTIIKKNHNGNMKRSWWPLAVPHHLVYCINLSIGHQRGYQKLKEITKTNWNDRFEDTEIDDWQMEKVRMRMIVLKKLWEWKVFKMS